MTVCRLLSQVCVSYQMSDNHQKFIRDPSVSLNLLCSIDHLMSLWTMTGSRRRLARDGRASGGDGGVWDRVSHRTQSDVDADSTWSDTSFGFVSAFWCKQYSPRVHRGLIKFHECDVSGVHSELPLRTRSPIMHC